MNVHGKRVAITGGSSGIGFELARQFGEKGARLVLTGCRAAVLAASVDLLGADGIEAHGIVGDVTDSAARDHLHTAL